MDYLTRHDQEIRAIELTDEEIKTACYNLQREKWYRDRGIHVKDTGTLKPATTGKRLKR